MNYRHAYHAGNFADVFKHVFLDLCLRYFQEKDKPFFYLDTHAGIGRYDLHSVESGKTGEWIGGVGRIHAAQQAGTSLSPPLFDWWQTVCADLHPTETGFAGSYLGSPCLAQRQMRPQDRLHLCELHPEDHASLRQALGRDARVILEERDGYQALKAVLPPKERRGMVLIDPPFERRDEFTACAKAVGDGLRRWASGCFAIWYPMKDPVELARFHDDLAALQPPKALALELTLRAPAAGMLYGCGYVFINPPYPVQQHGAALMEELCRLLAVEDGASWSITSLGQEDLGSKHR